MQHSFPEALALVLKHEGGYVNHPKDPGGATNKGVTQRTYNAWRKRQKQAARSVRSITGSEIKAIYKRNYWNRVRGDGLPAGLDYAVFDFGVNSGPTRAAKFLQRIVGTTVDGTIGPMTLKAVGELPPGHIIAELCSTRLDWLQTLKHWPTFGKGWTRRVNDVERVALEMASFPIDAPSPDPAPAPPRKPPDDPGPDTGPEPPDQPAGRPPAWLWQIAAFAALVAAFFVLT